jgi:hypothetical protein
VDSAARTVNVPILTTSGVTVLMIGSSSCSRSLSLQCLSDGLPLTSGRLDLRFREAK